MRNREDILKSPDYWFESAQNELFRQVIEYMEAEGINQTELATRLKVSKGYVSQILNGNFNYTLRKLIEISLAIGKVPKLTFKLIDNAVKEDHTLKQYYNQLNNGTTGILSIHADVTKNIDHSITCRFKHRESSVLQVA